MSAYAFVLQVELLLVHPTLLPLPGLSSPPRLPPALPGPPPRVTSRSLGTLWETFLPHPRLLRLRDQTSTTMRAAGCGSSLLFSASLVALFSASLVALFGFCSGGSDAPRGVAVGFVFDPRATCDPPCEHGGVCIRNNTCFCSKGYEGETCQYGDVTGFILKFCWFVCLQQLEKCILTLNKHFTVIY